MKNILFIIFLLLSLSSCKEESIPPQPESTLNLTLEDVSCTEAWITLTTTNLQLPATLDLIKDDNIYKTINLQTTDTLLYVDSLLPNLTYNFKLTSILNPVSSNELNVTTMDTTSHNFTWQMFEFGGGAGSSILNDVAFIDENNIWAVGEIKIADTSLNGYTKYCYLKWDGSHWETGRLKYFPPGSIGDSITTSGYSIFAFDENDIWISGGAIFHWDGTQWNIFYNTGADGANKIWGTSNNNLYFVGRNGNIVHYNGSQWRNIESGTIFNLTSATGNEDNAYFSGVNLLTNEGILLKYNFNTITVLAQGKIIGPDEVFKPFLYGEFQVVHSLGNELLLGGNFLYKYKFNSWDYVKSFPENFVSGNPNGTLRGFLYSIASTKKNDVIVSGDGNTLLHFNGYNWAQLGGSYSPVSNIGHRSIKFFNNTVISVGYIGNKAMVMKLER